MSVYAGRPLAHFPLPSCYPQLQTSVRQWYCPQAASRCQHKLSRRQREGEHLYCHPYYFRTLEISSYPTLPLNRFWAYSVANFHHTKIDVNDQEALIQALSGRGGGVSELHKPSLDGILPTSDCLLRGNEVLFRRLASDRLCWTVGGNSCSSPRCLCQLSRRQRQGQFPPMSFLTELGNDRTQYLIFMNRRSRQFPPRIQILLTVDSCHSGHPPHWQRYF